MPGLSLSSIIISPISALEIPIFLDFKVSVLLDFIVVLFFGFTTLFFYLTIPLRIFLNSEFGSGSLLGLQPMPVIKTTLKRSENG